MCRIYKGVVNIREKRTENDKTYMEFLWLSYYNDSLYNMGIITEDERNAMNAKITSRCSK